jgi:hypothetical protein
MSGSVIRSSFFSLLVAFALCLCGSGMAADCAPPKLVNSLAMEQVPSSDLMTVAASVDDRPVKLVVDTGAIPTQLWAATVKKLDYPADIGRQRYMDLAGRYSEGGTLVSKFALASMWTGRNSLHVSPDPGQPHADSDGLLGLDMMQRFDIDLDFAHQELNYFTPETCKGAGIYWNPQTITSVQMVNYAGLVYVPVTLDGEIIVALLDTSADRTFLNPAVASKYFGLTADSLEAGNVSEGGALIKVGVHKFSHLTFGGLTANNPEIAIPFDVLTQSTREFHASKVARDRFNLSEIMPDMVIGMDMLKYSHLYISFQNQRVYIAAAGDGPALKAPTLPQTYFNVWRWGYGSIRQPFVHL